MRTARFRRSPREVTLLLIAAAGLAVAGCAGSNGNEASTTGDSASVTESTSEADEQTTDDETTTAEAGPSPEVVAWARTWRRKVYAPVRKAASTFVANAFAAVDGDSSASYRVSAQLNTLSNCRNPIEIRLADTPTELLAARRLSLQACRSAYVGVDKFIKGWNQRNFQGYSSDETEARVRDGVRLVKKTLKLLKRAQRAVAKATAA